jgi:hypothetical protein
MGMKSTCACLFVACLALFSCQSTVLAGDVIGHVATLEGQATVTGADGKSRTLALKSDIYLDDKIATGKGAKLQIVLNDGSVLSEGESSEMTVDKYVYDPKNTKDVNASVKMAQGVFRVMTGKITEADPERFKVRTRMATIGIRGCQLGFRLAKDKEAVYIIELPKGKTILIQKMIKDALADSEIDRARILQVTEIGTAVLIQPGVDLMQRQMTPSETKQIMQESTPQISSTGRGDRGNLLASSQSSTSKDSVDRVTGAQNQNDSKVRLVAQLDSLKPEQGESQEPLPTGPVITPPTSAPYVAPPTTAPPSLVGGSPMGDYEWGVWADGTVYVSGNRTASPTPATAVSANEFAAIAASGTYNMSGSGDSGAVLNEKTTGTRKVVYGTCNIQVQIGPAAAPSWNGTFNLDNNQTDSIMNDPNNRLDFTADGSVSGGKLSLASGGPSSYTMIVNGNGYASPTVKTFTGDLIKPGQGPSPISAVIGEFNFEHGTSASAKGVFGADFAPY